MSLLEIENVRKSFGGISAVSGISFNVGEGETVGLIGPNGAGKTTLFNLVTGLYRPDGGSVRFQGREIAGVAPHLLAHRGIARTFQNLRLFRSLTVLENVLAAAAGVRGYGIFSAAFRTGAYSAMEGMAEAKARKLLDAFGLSGQEGLLAGSLPYGEQRRLELARALAAEPRLLLIDEPGAGMNPKEIRDLVVTIKEMRARFDLTIVIIEHQMGLLMNVSDRVVVMDFGVKIMEGPPEDVKKDRRVIEAYLGEDFACRR